MSQRLINLTVAISTLLLDYSKDEIRGALDGLSLPSLRGKVRVETKSIITINQEEEPSDGVRGSESAKNP